MHTPAPSAAPWSLGGTLSIAMLAGPIAFAAVCALGVQPRDGAARPAQPGARARFVGRAPLARPPGARPRRGRPARGAHPPRRRSWPATTRRPARRARAAQPDPATLLDRARRVEPSLWERRLDHSDALRVAVGYADLPYRPRLTGPAAEPAGPASPRVLSAVHDLGPLPDVPVVVDLRAGRALGLCGPPAARRAVARAVVAQLATLHGPADVELILVAPDAEVGTGSPVAPGWPGLELLPHTRRPAPTGPADAEAATRPPSDHGAGAGWPGPVPVLVVDDVTTLHAQGDVSRWLGARPPEGAALVLGADRADQLPACCTSVLHLDGDGWACLAAPGRGHRLDGVLATGVSEEVLEELARALTDLVDPERGEHQGGLPDRVTLDEVAPASPATPPDPGASSAAVWHRWTSACAATRRGQGPPGDPQRRPTVHRRPRRRRAPHARRRHHGCRQERAAAHPGGVARHRPRPRRPHLPVRSTTRAAAPSTPAPACPTPWVW